MIKQTFQIDESERIRILSLHESATKRFYLKEQNVDNTTDSTTPTTKSEKSWRLCETMIVEKNGKYYALIGEGDQKTEKEIPILSNVKGTIQNRDLNLDPTTQSGIEVGSIMKETQTCSNKFPQASQGNTQWFCYFDDVSTSLSKDASGKQILVKNNVPIYGVIAIDGSLKTGGGDFLDKKIPNDKDGVNIQYGVSRSRRFIIEVSPAMVGSDSPEPAEVGSLTNDKIEELKLDLSSPFEFDSTELTKDAKAEFFKFLNAFNENLRKYDGDVEIITSSSIDGDPNEQIKGGKTRFEYDMDLSKRRADAIIAQLESRLVKSMRQPNLRFIAKPLGQTDQFAKGKKWPEVKDNKLTAPNRRLIINLPKITVKKQSY